MAWLIYGPLIERWTPAIVGLRRLEPRSYTVLTTTAPPWEQRRKFSYYGDRFEPDEIRTEFWMHSGHRDFGDVFPVCAKWGCTAEWRREVEALEPGVHQFFPITIRRPRSKRPIYRLDGREAQDGDFFLFNCLQLIDAVIPERSTGSVRQCEYGILTFDARRDHLCVSREMIAGRHLWHGRNQEPGREHFFVSDALMDRFRAAGLKGFKASRVREA